MAAMWNWLMAAFCSRVCWRQSSGVERSLDRRRVEQQVLGQTPLFGRECEAKRSSFSRVDDGQVEPRLGAVIQEDRVDHFAGRGRQAERDVRDAEHGLHVGKRSP